jgi:hypothetical protein
VCRPDGTDAHRRIGSSRLGDPGTCHGQAGRERAACGLIMRFINECVVGNMSQDVFQSWGGSLVSSRRWRRVVKRSHSGARDGIPQVSRVKSCRVISHAKVSIVNHVMPCGYGLGALEGTSRNFAARRSGQFPAGSQRQSPRHTEQPAPRPSRCVSLSLSPWSLRSPWPSRCVPTRCAWRRRARRAGACVVTQKARAVPPRLQVAVR